MAVAGEARHPYIISLGKPARRCKPWHEYRLALSIRDWTSRTRFRCAIGRTRRARAGTDRTERLPPLHLGQGCAARPCAEWRSGATQGPDPDSQGPLHRLSWVCPRACGVCTDKNGQTHGCQWFSRPGSPLNGQLARWSTTPNNVNNDNDNNNNNNDNSSNNNNNNNNNNNDNDNNDYKHSHSHNHTHNSDNNNNDY